MKNIFSWNKILCEKEMEIQIKGTKFPTAKEESIEYIFMDVSGYRITIVLTFHYIDFKE